MWTHRNVTIVIVKPCHGRSAKKLHIKSPETFRKFTGHRVDAMELTPQEQRVCDVFSRDDGSGKVRCSECPLCLNSHFAVCKANVTEEEYEEWSDYE